MITLSVVMMSCGGSKMNSTVSEQERKAFNSTEADTVKISDEESNYEIIIIEPGFNVWLQAVARPPGYYSQTFLENRNRLLVIEWNNRVINNLQFDPQLYQLQIDYDPLIDYGYEVNYKLYNYFIYFQRKYNQRLGPFAPRI
ncbi:hypothetical protein GCM10011361_01690 [Muriicola marianensis]|uniref:Uncharacterized protein n=1 Tax=Muriicola marianensis TaxID=1324801 RepID=A0ABQ1QR50_9FLAO|nr:hypothetical protein GCM10011361_01690 [Muriicola marianensis]